MMEQRSNEWHKARTGRITGSICGAFLGHSPYMTREQAIRSMVRQYHGAPSEFVGGPHIDWGVSCEDDAIYTFEMETGLKVEKCGFFPYEDFAGASPDGLIGDDAIIECKAPYGKRNSSDFKFLADQPHYFDQVQMEMISSGRKKAYFYQWSPLGSKLEIVDYSQEWYDTYMPQIRQEFAFYLSELDNPEHLEPLRVELNTLDAKRLLDEYSQLSEAIDNATERKKEVLAAIVKAAGERNALVFGHKLTRVQKEGSISYAKAVKELLPGVSLEKYRGKGSEFWKLS